MESSSTLYTSLHKVCGTYTNASTFLGMVWAMRGCSQEGLADD